MNNVFIKNKKGQSILELAIFGSILISLLGVLVSYGLRYNYQQLETQRAFRKALGSTAMSMEDGVPSSVAHMLIEDRHIPNPSDSFGMGAITPLGASASVTRSAALHETPDTVDELPVSVYTINNQTYSFKNAGFVEESNVDETEIARYIQVYGETITSWNETTDSWRYYLNGNRTCVEFGPPRELLNITLPPLCLRYSYDRIRYIDSNAGEMISYEGMKRQCRIIIDSEVCEDGCRRSGGKDCDTICSQPIRVPWYCGTNGNGATPDTDYVEIDPVNHLYLFPVIEKLFAFTPGRSKTTGLQPGSLQEIRKEATLRKSENFNETVTRDTINLKSRTTQSLAWKKYGDTTTNMESQTVTSNTERKRGRIWKTPWD
jgi:hypothetical protein